MFVPLLKTLLQGICAPLLRKIRADLQRNAGSGGGGSGGGGNGGAGGFTGRSVCGSSVALAGEMADDGGEEEEEDGTVNRLNPRYSSGVSSPGRHVRTRLYFTSESHVHSLLTVIAEGGLVDVSQA